MYLIQVAGVSIDLERLVYICDGVIEKDGKFYIGYDYGEAEEPLF